MSVATPDLSLESRLCLACGLCCEGTVFGFAVLEKDEVEQAAQIGLTGTVTTDNLPTFSLPCSYLDGACCTRYQDWRPSICSHYFCHVQKRTQRSELTEEEAFARITRARQLAADVAALLPEGMLMTHARDHFKRLAAKQPDLTPEEAQFVVRMFVLERFLDAEFRGPKRSHLPGGRISAAQ